MKADFKISIITVCYNAVAFIECAIKSVLSQTYKNIEYIIIDGKSDDGTIEVVNKYKSKLSKLVSERDEGIYDAMNKGIKNCTGDIVYFLNSDDILYDGKVIEDVANQFLEKPEPALLYGNVIYSFKAENREMLRRFDKITRNNIIYEDLCHQAVFAKRSLIEELGMFNKQYKIVADYDWLLKVFFNKKYPVKYFDRVIAKFNYGGHHAINSDLHKVERMMVRLKYMNKIAYSLAYFIYRIKRKIVRLYEREKNSNCMLPRAVRVNAL